MRRDHHGGHGGSTEDTVLSRKVPCPPFVSVFSVVVLFVLVSVTEANAQGVGFTGGAAIDPAQAYVGSYLESARIANHIRVRAGIDGAFGGEVSEALIDFVFQYEIPFAPLSPWYVYQGSGPTVAIARENGERHASGGFLGIFGIGNKNGFFFEVKVSGGGGPNLRVGVGYTIRRKQP
jgi:hypothetical protein